MFFFFVFAFVFLYGFSLFWFMSRCFLILLCACLGVLMFFCFFYGFFVLSTVKDLFGSFLLFQ